MYHVESANPRKKRKKAAKQQTCCVNPNPVLMLSSTAESSAHNSFDVERSCGRFHGLKALALISGDFLAQFLRRFAFQRITAPRLGQHLLHRPANHEDGKSCAGAFVEDCFAIHLVQPSTRWTLRPMESRFPICRIEVEPTGSLRRSCLKKSFHFNDSLGGIGYITSHHAEISRNNILINAHMLEASRQNGVKRFLFSSSPCVYNQSKQNDPNVKPLREEDAHPADPEPGYGWEKLFAEELCRYYYQDYSFETRIVRFHNVYGPLGTYDGGKEKAPAAICRKIALAEDGGEIEVWGDGDQTRSFMYVDDCVEGLIRIMGSQYREPLNLGTDELVTINGLVDIVAGIAAPGSPQMYQAAPRCFRPARCARPQ